MKIALINPEHPSPSGHGHGGIASFIYTLASSLMRSGHQVHILLRQGTIPDELPAEIQLHTFNYMQRRDPFKFINRFFRDGTVEWEQGHARSIRRTLEEIHATDGLDIAEFADYVGLAHEMKNVPFAHCITFHTPLEIVDELNQTLVTVQRKRRYKFEHEALATTRSYRSPSEALKKKMCDMYGLDTSCVEIIRYPLDTCVFDKIEKIHFREDRIDVLFVGRLECRKGAEIILHSLKRIMRLDPRLHMTFVGETDLGDAQGYRDAIERSLSSDERNRIWFIGPVGHNELPTLYCRSSMLFFPSIFDNSPNTLLEAMAAKLPVIASDVGGVNEIIHDGENGLLFKLDDVEKMIGAFQTLINDKQTAVRLSEKAYDDLRQLHSPEKIVQQTIGYYKRQLKTA